MFFVLSQLLFHNVMYLKKLLVSISVATGYTGSVQECEEVWQEWHGLLYAKCVELEEEKQLMSFTSKM